MSDLPNKISSFWKNKYLKESNKSWNLFYKRNKTNFFKDRHWIDREFEELQNSGSYALLEIGCGVGNFVFPLIEKAPNATVYCCDVSEQAIELVKASPLYPDNRDRIFPFVCDISREDALQENIKPRSVDLVSMIFVLSALHPSLHPATIASVKKVLKPGGRVLFRDYAVEDQAQVRFKEDRKLEENLYVRQDGTLSYFFSVDYLASLFGSLGFQAIENRYVNRKTVNVKQHIDVDRKFLQSKWTYS